MPQAALLAIGNELLNGVVRDVNVAFLSRELTHMGINVECAALVRDRPSGIAKMLHYMLKSTPDILMCAGGLGPTRDDLTLAAVGQALEIPLKFNPEAFEQIKTHYARLWTQHYLTRQAIPESSRKMAMLPQGAHPLSNSVGIAPGVQMQYKSTLIYVLPGVPEELVAIFTEEIVPNLRACFDVSAWVEQALWVHCDDEAIIAPLLNAVAQRHPQVYLKSLVKAFPAAGKEGMRVIAGARASERAVAQNAVEQTLADFHQVAQAADLPVTQDE